ncbi:hypothetical protein JZU46_03115 [bacterium]|nr:hypothetical protein [bacterium]
MLNNKYISLGIIIANSFMLGRIYDKLNVATTEPGIVGVVMVSVCLILSFSYNLLTTTK